MSHSPIILTPERLCSWSKPGVKQHFLHRVPGHDKFLGHNLVFGFIRNNANTAGAQYMINFHRINHSILPGIGMISLLLGSILFPETANADYAIVPPSVIGKDGKVQIRYLNDVLIPMMKDSIKEASRGTDDFSLVEMRRGNGASIVMIWQVRNKNTQEQIKALPDSPSFMCSLLNPGDRELLKLIDYMEQDYVTPEKITIRETRLSKEDCRLK